MKRPGRIVGVRELRARLSAYLRDVAKGATVTIGDRRRQPVARLIPVRRSRDDEVLERLAARGVVRRGTGSIGPLRPVKPRRGRILVSDIVIADRR
jgi:prevent-host-death family protein